MRVNLHSPTDTWSPDAAVRVRSGIRHVRDEEKEEDEKEKQKKKVKERGGGGREGKSKGSKVKEQGRHTEAGARTSGREASHCEKASKDQLIASRKPSVRKQRCSRELASVTEARRVTQDGGNTRPAAGDSEVSSPSRLAGAVPRSSAFGAWRHLPRAAERQTVSAQCPAKKPGKGQVLGRI